MNRSALSDAAVSVVLLLWLTAALPAGATTYNPVDTPGLVAAVAGAAAGDSVVIACGTYDVTGLVLADGVVLRSAGGSADCVTLRTSGGPPVITCTAVGAGTRIEGLTFTAAPGGFVDQVHSGAGILLLGASPMIIGCRFSDLEASYGGALACHEGSSPVVAACTFTRNTARAVGGAVNCAGQSSPWLLQCLFRRNSTAIHAAHSSAPHTDKCTFVDNQAALTGWNGSIPAIKTSIITGGNAPWDGDPSCVPAFTCTDIWNSGADWSGLIADQAGAGGNLSADPLFCGWEAGDAMFGLAASSPCAPGAAGGCGLIGAFGVACEDVSDVPAVDPSAAATRILQAAPNPFNPLTHVTFEMKFAGAARVDVYDLAGRLVARLVAEDLPAGRHEVAWDGRDNGGRRAGAGVYLIRLQSGDTSDARRVTLLK